ncbi:tripartite tricarboxylate transporter substrate binding protein [Bordetella sp. BOR01]|uniref:tripartite tricarboxylate transporter substrate binding protein n=1 Tax=Bordetella sp. BOR01 TaxID=2854779 RepID=UPI001C4896D2|nr:tripartite tricarboxylate transporter substrate binding protein [Bordetella sp. BOR01]MBV7485146.1 tripartite tricarboxylate transporter substrate binding protein [Bordetella sp. BOR01]
MRHHAHSTRSQLGRRIITGALGAVLAGSMASALGAGYPDKPIRIVVPWPAGGLVDLPARLLADKLQAELGATVIVENKLGAGGTIGADTVAKAPADGYTLMVTTSAIAINQAVGLPQPFNLRQDFQPVAPLAYAPLILVTHPTLGPQSLADLIARARARPGQLNYASAGNGTPGHLAGEWLKSREKLDILHIAYKGGPPAMTDQIGGRVDFHFANAAVALPQIMAGKITALAVASDRRMPQLPQVPTMAEAGEPGFNTDQWIGLLAPRQTPAAVIERLNEATSKALGDPQVREAMTRSGITAADPASVAQFDAVVGADLDKWTSIVRTAHIKVE